jgi:hypothetical protein
MLDSTLLRRVYHKQEPVITALDHAVAYELVPIIAQLIKAQAKQIAATFSPDVADIFSQDAAESLLLMELTSLLTYDDMDWVDVILPSQMTIAHARFMFDLPEPPALPQPVS